MTAHTLTLTPHDPLVARDGRPFGAGQGYRMKGLAWPFPSVVAGSLRTALVKAKPGADFTGETPKQLLGVQVAGVFPVTVENPTFYLPAPADCLIDRDTDTVHRVEPIAMADGEGADFPIAGLRPVTHQEKEDFKPKEAPAWWPSDKLAEWLVGKPVTFDKSFLLAAKSDMRDHVELDAATGAAKEGRIFATSGLSLTHLPRFGQDKALFREKFAEVTLSARVTTDNPEFANLCGFDIWHPLGGERRMVHWKRDGDATLWECPKAVRDALPGKQRIRMVLATPAIFADGWKPGWLNAQLEGVPPCGGPKLRLVGVSIKRWQAVSGWSLQPIPDSNKPKEQWKPGPKAIRRMVPAGGVYFFETTDNAVSLADQWLHPVSDDPQDRNDGFGLAVWGTW